MGEELNRAIDFLKLPPSQWHDEFAKLDKRTQNDIAAEMSRITQFAAYMSGFSKSWVFFGNDTELANHNGDKVFRAVRQAIEPDAPPMFGLGL